MLLAGRLSIPAGARALLFDLDGVLLDSLSLDYEIVARLLQDELGQPKDVPHAVIEDNFALAIPDFWQQVSNTLNLDLSANAIENLTEAHESARRGSKRQKTQRIEQRAPGRPRASGSQSA